MTSSLSRTSPSPYTEIDYGVIVVGRGGVIKHANESARRSLRDFFGMERTTRLPKPLRGSIAVRRRPYVAGDLGRPRGRAFAVERNGRRLVVRIIPYGAGGFFVFEEEERRETAGPAAFRLTHREAEVLSWVSAGKTNQEIATILGISPRTVKKHLEHVYDKLGVETRTAAAAVTLGSVIVRRTPSAVSTAAATGLIPIRPTD